MTAINHRWGKRLGLAAVFFGLVFASYRAIHWYRWREQPDAATGVALELRLAQQVIKVGEAPSLVVTLVNRGNKDVKLVEPGDGSECGWRTPIIEWSWRSWSWFDGIRCGNMNPLKTDEIFVVKPGESRRLCKWADGPPFSAPGRYRLSIRYTNIPDHWWRYPNNPAALDEVRSSMKLSTVSNSVEIVVE